MSTSSSSNGTSARTASTVVRARSQRWQPAAVYSVTRATAASSARRLRVEAARRRRLGDALNGEAVRGHAHRGAPRLLRRPGLVERARDDVVELRVHLDLLPEVLLEALHPLEVRDDDAAGVREHVGEDEHAGVLEDLVRTGGRGPVRALAEDLGPDLVGVPGMDHLLERARRQDVALEQEQLLVRDRIGAAQAGERPGLALVGERRGDV